MLIKPNRLHIGNEYVEQDSSAAFIHTAATDIASLSHLHPCGKKTRVSNEYVQVNKAVTGGGGSRGSPEIFKLEKF
jgi:hypothetical protein